MEFEVRILGDGGDLIVRGVVSETRHFCSLRDSMMLMEFLVCLNGENINKDSIRICGRRVRGWEIREALRLNQQ